MTQQSEFYQAVASRSIVRVREAAIVISGGRVLVQRPSDEPTSCYAFVGSSRAGRLRAAERDGA